MLRRLVVLAILGTFAVTWMFHDAQAEDQKLEVIHNRVYYIADLPVWQFTPKAEPKFDAKILIAYIKTTVSPDSWFGDAEIRPFNKNASLVVAQTAANHEKIADLLSELRPARTGETEERVGKSDAK